MCVQPDQDRFGQMPQMPDPMQPWQPAGVPQQTPPVQQGQPVWPQQPQQAWQQPVPPQGYPQQMMPPQAYMQGAQQQPFMPGMQPQPMYQQTQYDAYMQQPPAQPTAQQPAAPPKRRRKPKKKKSGGRGSVWKIVLVLLAVAALAWFFLKDMIGGGRQATATIEMGTLGTSYSGDALIVRNETAYDEEGVQTIEYVAQEGGVVYRGDVICYVYSTGYSTKEMTTLQDQRDQIKDYQQTLLGGETAYDQKMTRLENEVIERGLEVRSLVQGARGNLINQESILETAITQRQNYFRSKYSSDMRLNRLYDDETNQQQRIDSWISQEVAMQESIVSFYTDGFEHALTPGEFEKYTPTQVRAMINGERPETSTAARGRTDLYRLVKQNNYAVLMLVRDNTWNPVEGTTYRLTLEQFTNTVVDAQVLSFTRSGGELLLRLAVMGDVSDVLYMRTCQAQLGEYVDCLVVPEKALYTQQNGSDAEAVGVVLILDGQQYFVPVKVLRQEGGKAYIASVQSGVLAQGQTVRLFD